MSKLSEWIENHKDDPDHERAVRTYRMNANLFEREFEEANAQGAIVECQHCGYPENPLKSLEGDKFIKNQCCFDCWFYLHNLGLKNGPRPGSVIVKGEHYSDSGMRSGTPSSMLGFGGAKWTYRKLGTDEWVVTNNMWYQGKIPKRFGIADTHEFKPHAETKAELLK